MKLNQLLGLLLVTAFIFTSCQKEVSVELGSSTSSGSLQADGNGECLPKTVQGIYESGKVLDPATNFIDVQVNVASPGSYKINSDTINGIFFQGTGTFATAGLSTIRLAGNGTPQSAGTHTFSIRYGSSSCSATVTTVAPGGGGQAEFTLAGAPDQCMNPVISGDYVVGVAMTAANTVVISVDVTVLGTYTISTTPSNGLTFSASGTFANTGVQNVTLTASGTPMVDDVTNILVIAGSGNCSFDITVTAQQQRDYFPLTAGSNWSYQFDDDANDSIWVRAKPGTVDLGGNSYTIFEGTADFADDGFEDINAYRKSGSSYYTYMDIGYYFGFDDPQFVEYIFLKDDVDQGGKWQSPQYNGNITDSTGTYTFTIRIAFTIVQKDVAVTVGGVSYPNTIVVDEKYEVLVGQNWEDITDILGHTRSYYARDIGLIRYEYYYEDGNSNPTTVVLKQDLRRHEVL